MRSPNPDPGDSARAWPEGRRWPWVRAEGALCAGTCSGSVPYQKQNIFYTLKKKKLFLPLAWISSGLFLKPCLGWELRVSRDGGDLRPGGPQSRGPGIAHSSDAPRLVSGHQTRNPGGAPAAARLTSMPVTRGVGTRSAEGSQRLRAGRALLPAPQKPPNSHLTSLRSAARPPRAPVWAEPSP